MTKQRMDSVMIQQENNRSWIFVSHSSEDIVIVRKIRNYLEEKGASPLLFHLMALKEADEFWPLIEREILVRNFFLYCDSPAAQKSVWVQKERATVEVARGKGAKRVGRISVDKNDVDWSVLDEFLSKKRVYLSYSHKDRYIVELYNETLVAEGFNVFIDKQLESGVNFNEEIQKELNKAVIDGFVVVYLSRNSILSSWINEEVNTSISLGGRVVLVYLEEVRIPREWENLHSIDAHRNPESGPNNLVRSLLSI